MPLIQNFGVDQYSDQIATITLAPPVNINNWNLQFTIGKRFGGTTTYYQAGMTSGMGNNYVSGISIQDTAAGIFNVRIPGTAFSGLPYANYAYAAKRLDSGSRNTLTEGYILLGPTLY